MKHIIFAATALALAGSAAAFDNATCKTFLAGTWNLTTERQADGKKIALIAHSTYSPDGTFRQERQTAIDGAGQPPQSITGTWDAGPGQQPDQCAASVTPQGQSAMSLVLTVVDDNTVKGPQGDLSVRQH